MYNFFCLSIINISNNEFIGYGFVFNRNRYYDIFEQQRIEMAFFTNKKVNQKKELHRPSNRDKYNLKKKINVNCYILNYFLLLKNKIDMYREFFKNKIISKTNSSISIVYWPSIQNLVYLIEIVYVLICQQL